uniref:Uncharacterized protein n=1 Tax=Trypanosoma congolense (strain IL3000) TaxID=1068625 RepID=G0UN61_TRYCI|nr:hypothetical protein, unlikely [Trypanosoma congolense IL3000]
MGTESCEPSCTMSLLTTFHLFACFSSFPLLHKYLCIILYLNGTWLLFPFTEWLIMGGTNHLFLHLCVASSADARWKKGVVKQKNSHHAFAEVTVILLSWLLPSLPHGPTPFLAPCFS